MTTGEIAKLYNVSIRTAKRYRKLGAPVSDEPTMREWIVQHHSRLGLGKGMRRQTRVVEPVRATIAPVREVVAEIIPVEPAKTTKPASEVSADEPETDEGTLRRLEAAERTAYRRYLDSGGNERAGQLWLLCTDQLRKFRDSAAKRTSDVSEAETKFFYTCGEVIHNFHLHLETAPKLLGMLCEGLERDAIAEKVVDQLRRTIGHAVMELADAIRGTSLEILLPPHERGRRAV
jgi:hypothetical protein